MIFYVNPSNLKSLFQAGKDMIHQMAKIRLNKPILKDVGGMIQKMTNHHQEGETFFRNLIVIKEYTLASG